MGRSQKIKGAIGEREVAAIAREHGFKEAHRGRQYHGGSDSPDVAGIPGLHTEVKRVERLNLQSAIIQSREDAGDDEIPVVIHRRSREPWYITLSYESFLDIYKDSDYYRRFEAEGN